MIPIEVRESALAEPGTWTRYGWVITADHINTDDSPVPTPSQVGVMGPASLADELEERLLAGEGTEFRMFDDDGELYYEGRLIGDHDGDDGFCPLSDFGRPDTGCTTISYLVNGKWVTW